MKTKDNSFSGFPGCWNMVVLVIFVTRPNFWVILGIVVVIAASMFTRLEFVHPVRTERWKSVTLPMAFAWTFLAGLAAWQKFDPGIWVVMAITGTSLYLLFAGIAMQIVPAKTA